MAHTIDNKSESFDYESQVRPISEKNENDKYEIEMLARGGLAVEVRI